MTERHDLIVIGAGPAGMAAAIQAAKHGLSVLVLGEQPLPGGQMYRGLEQGGIGLARILGSSYAKGVSLVRDFRSSQPGYQAEATVWQIEPDGWVYYSTKSHTRQVRGQRIIIATGAKERPMPIPGWTLPGVMAATASDVLLKSHGIVPFSNIVLAGSGPLLLLTASRLIKAGAGIKALLDTTPAGNLAGALPRLPKALLGAQYLLKGLTMQWDILSSRIPVYKGVDSLKALGDGGLERVEFSCKGKQISIEADTLLLQNGVVPDTQLTALLGCDLAWDELNRYWKPLTNSWGDTSCDKVSVAGDAAGILGGGAAEALGRIAALHAAYALGKITRQTRNQQAGPWRRRLILEQAARPFLDRLFKPATKFLTPQDDDTLVCRCEEISAGQIKQALRLGALGPNQLKAQTRAGMGPCQGRMCGLIISEMIARHHGLSVAQVGWQRVRPPAKPLTIQQLASLEAEDSALD
jgi:thioredoxin reductase/bacterioferritin-associated ferredoxin